MNLPIMPPPKAPVLVPPPGSAVPPAPKDAGRKHMKDTEAKASRDPDSLTAIEKQWRDRFVAEYIKDFNATQAMIRCGHTNPNTARTQGSLMLREPYVARKVDDFVRKVEVDAVVTRQQVMSALWKEANNGANFEGVRVTALSKIATMLGMDKAPKPADEEKGTVAKGVMLVPIINVADWQAAAMQTQADLKTRAGAEVTLQTHDRN